MIIESEPKENQPFKRVDKVAIGKNFFDNIYPAQGEPTAECPSLEGRVIKVFGLG